MAKTATRAAPMVVYSAPKTKEVIRYRTRAAAKRVGKHRTHGRAGRSMQNTMMGGAIGGFAVGIIEKNFPQIPTLPVVGKKGAIALAVYFFKPKNKLLRDVGFAAAVLAGNEFGMTGKISGAAASQVGVVRQT